jgi:hypothetical protein
LQAASKGGHLDLVGLLIKENAHINANPAHRNGRTALQAAAEGGHLAVVERLIQEKADINARLADRSGRTALQSAAGSGHLAVDDNNNNNNSSLLSLWNQKIMKGTLRLLPFHLHMLPCAVTFVYPAGGDGLVVPSWLAVCWTAQGSWFKSQRGHLFLSEIIRQPQATVRGDQWHWQEDKDRRLDFYILEQSRRKG